MHVGVAVGSGWQSRVAWINIICYYMVGLPMGLLMGFGFQWGTSVSLFIHYSLYTISNILIKIINFQIYFYFYFRGFGEG